MFKKLDKIICRIEESIIAFALLSGAAALFINVVLRYFFKSGIVWAEEYTRYAIIWLTFIGGSVAVRKNAHLSVTALLEAINKNSTKRMITLVSNSISILFTVFLTIWGANLTKQIAATNQLTPSMEIPTFLIYIAIPIGGALMTMRFLQEIYKEFKTAGEED